MLSAMRTTIDKAGRVVIPKRLRERLALKGGEEIEIEEVGDRIEIRRARADDDELVRSPHGVLTFRSGPGLDPDQVRELLERSRNRDL